MNEWIHRPALLASGVLYQAVSEGNLVCLQVLESADVSESVSKKEQGTRFVQIVFSFLSKWRLSLP